jgi:apolipoprotein N-acyltransferase
MHDGLRQTSLALLSGVLLALSFPRFGDAAFAWIALVPLLLALTGWQGRPGPLPGVPARRAFLLGLTAGLVYFAGTIYWTSTVLSSFGGVSAPVATAAMLLLALYMAIYPALTALLIARFVTRGGLAMLWLAPAAWVSTEFARGLFFGGFPWVPLGNSQVEMLPIAQLASVTGVYGLSALVVLVNAGLVVVLLADGWSRRVAGGITVGVVVLVAAWGTWRLADDELTREGRALEVGLIQGNISQEDKRQPSEARRIFTTHVAMTRDVVRRGAQYVLWPESSTPFMLQEDPSGEASVRALAREVGVPLLIGSEQLVRDPAPRLYNAAFQLAPDGVTAAIYRKIHLVPFGEYVPFRRWLFFVSPLVDSPVEFSPGTSVVLLPVGEDLVSVAICYEVIYPALIRQAVRDGSQLLTTITNDGWYGDSSAPYQHFAMASMRAIEQGRYLARSANTGISGIVDPYGRVVKASSTFEQVGLVGEVRLLRGRTLYSYIGDVVAYLALALSVLGLIATNRRM